MSKQTIDQTARRAVPLPGSRPAVPGETGRPRLELRESLTAEAARTFTDLLLAELPSHYDEVDATFPESIIDNAGSERDPFGYFTLGKDVYAGYLDGRCAGFTVVTIKRGGSAKIGPTAVLPEFRRTGVASALRDAVERKLYEERGVRKLYMTVSASNVPALLFNVDRGFHIEGILRDQYRRDQDEFVLGAFHPSARASRRIRTVTKPDHWPEESVSTAGLWTDPDVGELRDYLEPRLAASFDELDSEFYQAIIDACQESRQSYRQKGKRLLAARTGSAVSAVAVYVPKRGGSVKLSPCVADSPDAAGQLIAACVALAASEQRRKIYVHVPDSRFDLVELLVSRGFAIEAQLREAYKPGADMLVLGRLLT